jgi:hypothetical protein
MFPDWLLESGGGGFFIVMFGQTFAYSAFSRNHFSSSGCAKPESRKNERDLLRRTAGTLISAMQSNAERQWNLAGSPIVFVIVQETRDPRFQ